MINLFVDMDGVLADFDRGFMQLCGKYPHHFTKKEVWAIIHKRYDDGYLFFRNLPLMVDAEELWANIDIYHPTILTATGHSIRSAEKEKIKWKHIHFPNTPIHFVKDGADKRAFVTNDPEHTDILIDDRAKAIDPWIKAGGVGILHTSARQTLKELTRYIR